MKTRTKAVILFSVVMIILVGVAFIKVPQVYEFFDRSPMDDGNGTGNGTGTDTGNGDDSGSLEAKTSLYIYDESGNVQQVAWMAGFKIEEGAIPQEGDYSGEVTLQDVIDECNSRPGFYWDITDGQCQPTAEADDTVDGTEPDLPDVDYIPISGDFEKIVFVLDWAEIEGYKIDKNSVYIKIKARILLKDNTWSGVVDSLDIKYWQGDFKDLSVSGDYFKIRADAETMDDNDINVHKDEILSEVSYADIAQPLQIRFYYYAKGDPIEGGDPIESNTINKIIVIEGDLGASLGISGMIYLTPAFMAVIPRRLEYAKAN